MRIAPGKPAICAAAPKYRVRAPAAMSNESPA
jgi:hypothetical protein